MFIASNKNEILNKLLSFLKTRPDKPRQAKTSQDKPRQDKTRQDKQGYVRLYISRGMKMQAIVIAFKLSENPDGINSTRPDRQKDSECHAHTRGCVICHAGADSRFQPGGGARFFRNKTFFRNYEQI